MGAGRLVECLFLLMNCLSQCIQREQEARVADMGGAA